MKEPSKSMEPERPGWLRAAALAAAVVLPAAWLASLTGQPDHLAANAARVGGGALFAVAAWALPTGRRPTPHWRSFLAAGLFGSLAVTGLSILFPTLGRYSASGWLVSGLVGGGVVALAAFAVRRSQG